MKSGFKIHRFFLKFLLVLVIVFVIGVCVFIGLQISGKKRLYGKSESKRPDLASAVLSWNEEDSTEDNSGASENGNTEKKPVNVIVEEDSDNWEEGDVRYNGVHYRYNSEMLTFLFMGVDKDGSVKTAKNGMDGGQSDAIFLLALNPKTKEASLINVHRDTITEIDVYDKAGNYVQTLKSQITLQHAYGDGKELSCQRSVKAVSNLFYGLPIHGYCAINMAAIPKLNDAIGGVEVVVQEDITDSDTGKLVFKAGQKVKLRGKNATLYLRARDCNEFGSAGKRSERQKQYIFAYANTALDAIKKDVTTMVNLYNTISKYMVTDITVDEVSYFSTQAADYRFGEKSIYSLEGETVMGVNYEEFHVNDRALFELVLKVFYETVDD